MTPSDAMIEGVARVIDPAAFDERLVGTYWEANWHAVEGAKKRARAVLAYLASVGALVGEGMVAVPREPTPAMLEDEGTWAYAHDEDAAGVWRSMVAVASGGK